MRTNAQHCEERGVDNFTYSDSDITEHHVETLLQQGCTRDTHSSTVSSMRYKHLQYMYAMGVVCGTET